MKLFSSIFFLIILLIFILPVSANLNITIQSENNQSVDIIDISSNAIVASGYDNQSFILPYKNYKVQLMSNPEKTLTVANMLNFGDSMAGKLSYLVLIIFLLAVAWAWAKGFK